MKKALKVFTILTCAVLVMAANFTAEPPQTIKLSYNPKTGSSTKYLMVMTAVTGLEGLRGKDVPAIPVQNTTKVNATFTQKINKIDAKGNLDMSVIYNDVSLEIEQAGEKTSIPLGNKMGGKSAHIKISKDGKILEMKGIEDLPAEFKDFNLQKLYPQVNPSFPEGGIKVGDTWSQNVEETIPVTQGVALVQKMKIDYTLNALNELKGYKCASIGVKVKIEINGKWEKGEASTGVGLQSTGEGTGVMNYAYKASKLLNSKLDMNVNSQMRVGSGKEAQESKIKQKISINMEMIQ